MATPSTRPTSNGTSTPTAPSRPRDWSSLRNGESGSAFRGLTKGRGGGAERGGGRSGGRSGRGGRAAASRGGRGGGGNQDNSPKTDVAPTSVDAPAVTKSASAAGPSTSAEKPPTLTLAPVAKDERAPRPRGPPRRTSRSVPALVVAPSSPVVEAPPAAGSARPLNRRRRSQQQGKSPASPVLLKQNLSIDPVLSQNHLHPQRARTGPSTPTSEHKDAPPHLFPASAAPDVSTFDMKHNLDVLVDRVRAAAMDSHRPTTPGSHIDWAGDDDDSLPDLDDWGVTTSTSSAIENKADIEISPILVDDLKPLPATIDSKPGGESTPREEKSESKAPQALQLDSGIDINIGSNALFSPSPTPRTAAPTSLSSDSSSAQLSSSSAPAGATFESSKSPLHPSLPAKPVAAVPNLAKTRLAAIPMRVSIPLQHAAAEKNPAAVGLPVSIVEEVPTSIERSPTAVVKLPVPTVTVKLPESVVASAPAESSAQEESTEDLSHKQGLAASIHAPSSLPGSASLPHLPFKPLADQGGFNPTHQRAHTVGRFQQPQTAPFTQQRFSRSGTSSPQGGYDQHAKHGRTHSSPPAGSGLNPRVHAHRPVITGDAISRLARTIGGAPPSRPKEVSVAKE